jgi:hypothetical protein
MTAAYFEDHPTDPDKVIFRKPPLDQSPDYERGFVDGMLYQTQSSVYKAVNRLAQPEQEPVACERCKQLEEQGYDLLGKLKVANIKLSMRSQRIWAGLMRGVRVEGDTVVITVKGGNDAARELCGALIEEMNK